MAQIVLPYDRSPAVRSDLETDFALLRELKPFVGMVKLGLEAMTAQAYYSHDVGSRNVADAMRERLHGIGVPVLWDMKLHDISNTVAAAVRNLDGNGMTSWATLHASASRNTLEAAAKARDVRNLQKEGRHRLRLFGVTVLTDISHDECVSIFGVSPTEVVTDFAKRLIDAGIDGIVCSGQELEALAERGLTEHLTTLVPGLRSSWAAANDQKRIMTPADAAELGADYLVIGRQIMAADDPIEAARRTRDEIAAVSRGS